ncbi:PEP-CTERM sorting domain-containing protein [Adhaeretor mobilis]|uniref:PEP-CTERM protein-sorting domain-containing protein n=1 Tax=Adhaeretor mobilis TaxID=1930276 RepID=A0A517MXG8_9BACT|nr:PEP-CTERM sorting domain-containing protein [Adhaeretor mobilis]QDS99578.1 hypothetical protein HG15A2_29030 [Adhaeretor mobilis]
MSSHHTIRLVLTGLVLAVASPSFAQTITFYEWQPTDAQTWNSDPNWLQTLGSAIPDTDAFPGESARINNGGTAVVSVDVPRVAGIEVLNGAIDIQTGGQLDTVGDMTSGATGSLTVGGAGAVNLSGSGQLTVGGNLSNGGTVQLTGPGASFSVSGNFSSTGGTVAANITNASSHSVISVAGVASLGGTLNVNFSGVSPSVGDTWNLFDATAISGGYGTANVPSGLPTGTALFYQTQTGGSNGTLGQVTADVQLKLSINPRSGATSIENLVAGENEQIDGYLIKSAAGSLVTGPWTSFRDAGDTNWTESNAGPNSIGELNLASTGTVAGAGSKSLGNIYSFNPTTFGQAEPTPTFEYHVPGGGTRTGLVEFDGPRNNLVLLVDPATGDAAIQNQSTFNVAIDGYLVTSASSALDPANNDSLGSGWTESNQAANHIGELNLNGSLALSGGSAPKSLGSLFDVGGEQDLDFQFHLADGNTMTGIVRYGEFSLLGGNADFNENNLVEGADFLTWQSNVGNPNNIPDVSLNLFGDANGDLAIDGDDLTVWRTQYGSAPGTSVAAVSAVPEPSTIGLLLVAFTSLVCSQRRKGTS